MPHPDWDFWLFFSFFSFLVFEAWTRSTSPISPSFDTNLPIPWGTLVGFCARSAGNRLYSSFLIILSLHWFDINPPILRSELGNGWNIADYLPMENILTSFCGVLGLLVNISFSKDSMDDDGKFFGILWVGERFFKGSHRTLLVLW